VGSTIHGSLTTTSLPESSSPGPRWLAVTVIAGTRALRSGRVTGMSPYHNGDPNSLSPAVPNDGVGPRGSVVSEYLIEATGWPVWNRLNAVGLGTTVVGWGHRRLSAISH
jgi:hypothetical protein